MRFCKEFCQGLDELIFGEQVHMIVVVDINGFCLITLPPDHRDNSFIYTAHDRGAGLNPMYQLLLPPSSSHFTTLTFHMARDLAFKEIGMQGSARLVPEPPAHSIPDHTAILLQNASHKTQVIC